MENYAQIFSFYNNKKHHGYKTCLCSEKPGILEALVYTNVPMHMTVPLSHYF